MVKEIPHNDRRLADELANIATPEELKQAMDLRKQGLAGFAGEAAAASTVDISHSGQKQNELAEISRHRRKLRKEDPDIPYDWKLDDTDF